jgi:DnaJ-class molecular chaperone
MRYYCETCDGTGTVDDDESVGSECSICEGSGMAEICISRIKIGADLRHRDELLALQRDARRVISDCGKMLVCNPPHWKSYVSQLEKTIENLENQALDLLP